MRRIDIMARQQLVELGTVALCQAGGMGDIAKHREEAAASLRR